MCQLKCSPRFLQSYPLGYQLRYPPRCPTNVSSTVCAFKGVRHGVWQCPQMRLPMCSQKSPGVLFQRCNPSYPPRSHPRSHPSYPPSYPPRSPPSYPPRSPSICLPDAPGEHCCHSFMNISQLKLSMSDSRSVGATYTGLRIHVILYGTWIRTKKLFSVMFFFLKNLA